MKQMKIPGAFSTNIMKRYMQDKELQDFLERYKDNCKTLHGRNIMEPSANDLRIASHLRKSKSYKETAEKLGISDYKIQSALLRVATWEK